MLRRPLLALAALSLLSGCVSFGPKPPKQLLGLTADARVPAGQSKTTRDVDAVGVGLPVLPAELRNQRIAAQTGASFAYLGDAAWVDTPAQMFRGLLAETIEARTGRFVPDPRNPAITPDTRLNGSLAAFHLLGGQGKVLVVFDATVARSGSDTIRARRFEASAPVAGEDAAEVAAALNRAANAVAADVADWVVGN